MIQENPIDWDIKPGKVLDYKLANHADKIWEKYKPDEH